MVFFNRVKHIVWIVVGIFSILFVLSRTPVYTLAEMQYGLTFSSKQSQDLGLDWHAVYLAILDDLQVKKIRLPVYWDQLAPEKDNYNWTDLDWQIDEAQKRNVELILVVGQRVPRWPECHLPGWVSSLNTNDRQAATLEHIKKVVSRYKDRPTVRYWQVENEPFLTQFGVCPAFSKDFLDQEIKEVRDLDTRPIIVTDSGELSLWISAAKRGDIFGTTLYRDTYSSLLHSYIHYPLTPSFFRVKKNITNLFAHPQDWIIIEAQGEPWGREAFQNLSQAERDKTMTPEKFQNTIEFARQTGFQTVYWWGVEWWYWEKTTKNNPFYWDTAKKLFNGSYGQK